jgi:hypothetical protein
MDDDLKAVGRPAGSDRAASPGKGSLLSSNEAIPYTFGRQESASTARKEKAVLPFASTGRDSRNS